MIPSTQNSEPHVNQIKIQNEIKTIETKKSTNNSLTSVRYSELLKQEICGKLFTSTNVYKMDISGANARKEGLNSERKEPVLYPTEYWVQVGALDEADAPIDYTPDMNSFVAKASFLTFIMFFCTTSFVSYVSDSNQMRQTFSSLIGLILFVVGGMGLIILSYSLHCSPCMRMFPYNYLVLIITVICMSLFAAYITAYYKTLIIAYDLTALTVTVFVIMLLALTRFNFKKYIIYVIVVGVAYTVLTVIVLYSSSIGLSMKPAHQAILFIVALLHVVFIVIDLQMILGAKTLKLGEDEYAFGAYFLYTSITDFVYKILQIIVCIHDGKGF